MERKLVLGIDYGGKYTGLAVVDTGNNNQVLYARTVKMRDDIADILKGRREQRRIRRAAQTKKKRLRELDACLRSMGLDRRSSDIGREVYRLAHKRGYDYIDFHEPTPEELEAMNAEERKEYEKKKKEWEDTARNSRHREEVLRDVRGVLTGGGVDNEKISRLERIFNKDYRPNRVNNRILTKCKVEDCGKNTPLKKNVRPLLVENIVRFLPVEESVKNDLKAAVLDPARREDVKSFFRRHSTDQYIRKQIYDIADNKLSGRTVFCSDHILEHEKHTKEERKAVRIAPSLKTKIDNVLNVIKGEVLPRYTLSGVVMESNNFDIAAKTAGKSRLAKDEYGKGNKEKKDSLLDILVKETGGRCVYCGKGITLSSANKDHIYPRKAGGCNIFANLAACCRECNEAKRGRTPMDSGIMPHPDVLAVIENPLKRKILEDAMTHNSLDFSRYMSHASIGWRFMRDELRRVTGNSGLPIERQSGLVTSYFRKWWGFKKERENSAHHALDAVILAARKDFTDDGKVDMRLKPVFDPSLKSIERAAEGMQDNGFQHIEFKRDKGRRGAALHDRNPLSFKNGTISQKKMVTEIEREKEDAVSSDFYREKLKEAFESFNTKAGKCLTDEQAVMAGFVRRKCGQMQTFRCEVSGTGPGQMIRVKNNVFKTNVHNIGVAVFVDEKGKRRAIELKNPRLERHLIVPPEKMNGRMLFKLMRGDKVEVIGEEGTFYTIKKLGTSPTLEPLIAGEGRSRTVSAARLRKA